MTVTTSTIIDMTGLLIEYADSVRDWHENVLLPRAGASGAFPMPAKWDATNLVVNPKPRFTASKWSPVTGCTIARAAVTGVDPDAGTGVIRATQTGVQGIVHAGEMPAVTMVSWGERHTASAWVRCTAGATISIGIQYYGQFENSLGVTEATYTVGSAWTRLDVTSWVKQYAVTAVVSLRISGTASGVVWDIDQAMLIQEDKYAPVVPDRIPYFDGNTPVDAEYTYGWESGSNNSPSIRTATPGERQQSLYYWGEYRTLWDYLDPFLQEAGYRLWCDENRYWRCDPVGETRPGSSTVTAGEGGNMLDATDVLSRDQDTWADGVLLRYTYVDAYGNGREAFGSAGGPGGVANTLGSKIVILDRPGRAYTGETEAQRVLAQLRGRGRVFRLSALRELSATPGTTATVTLPGGETLTGKVESVIHNLQTGVADITPRDMAPTP
jgi:hypothetical protein